MAEVLHCAKFGRNRSSRGRDMARVRTTNEEHLVVFITVQNLVRIDAVVSIISKF